MKMLTCIYVQSDFHFPCYLLLLYFNNYLEKLNIEKAIYIRSEQILYENSKVLAILRVILKKKFENVNVFVSPYYVIGYVKVILRNVNRYCTQVAGIICLFNLLKC